MTGETYSNCPLGFLYLWLRGLADRVVVMRSDSRWFPWHFGALRLRYKRVIHFKHVAAGQELAPVFFRGRMRISELDAVQRSGQIICTMPAGRIVPWLLVLVAVVLPVWMVIACLYWPWWLLRDSAVAVRKRRCLGPLTAARAAGD